MKKLLCMLFLLFPIIVYSQVQNEWQRAAEQQIKEYYQAKLDRNEKALRNAQNELDELSRLPDSEFTAEVKSRGAYLGAKIEALKAERKALKEEFDNRLRDLHRQTTAKPVQSQKPRQPEKAARQKQNQSRMAATSKKTEEEAQRKRTEEAARKAKEEAEAARKAKEEQAHNAQFDSNKQKAMQTSEFYYNTQRAYVEHTASPQAFGQICAATDNCQVQRTLDGVPSQSNGSNGQMPNSRAVDRLRSRINNQESTRLFEQKLAARTAAGEGRYDENWSLEQKKEALSIWLGSDAKMQKLSKNNMEKNLVNGLKTESANAQRDQATFMSASGAEQDRALQRQYRGVVPDREYTEPYFLSKLDVSEQSRVIDALVVQSKDKGLVNPDILKKVVNKVDYGVARNNGKDLEGSDDLTQRANAVLEALRTKCAGGFCNKQYQEK